MFSHQEVKIIAEALELRELYNDIWDQFLAEQKERKQLEQEIKRIRDKLVQLVEKGGE